MKLVHRKIKSNYDKNAVVYLFDKDKNLTYYLNFERYYERSYRGEKETTFFYKAELVEYNIAVKRNHYGRKERSINITPIIDVFLDLKKITAEDYSYELFRKYEMPFEEFKSKFKELILEDKSFIKDSTYLEYVSEINENIKKTPVDYYLTLQYNSEY